MYNKNCPYRIVKIKKLDLNKPYIKSEIKAALKEKHRLQRLFNKKPITYGELFRAARNRANKLVANAKNKYYRNKFNSSCSSGKTKETWQTLNSVLCRNCRNDIPAEMIVNGEICKEKTKIANSFNEYFSNIGERLAEKLPKNNSFKEYLRQPVRTSFAFNPCSEREIIDIVNSLENSTSPGIDDIPVWLLKDNINSLSKIVTAICNLSMAEGLFPEKLAVAIIVCLHKSGNPSLLDNYRGISLPVIYSKVLEKIVARRVVKYFTENSLFIDSQFGFRKGLSTENAIQVLANAMYDSFENDKSAVGVFIDLSKAFDSLDRDYLCAKLEYYGVRDVELQWFSSYLNSRKQCVRFKDEFSSVLPTNFGVPQGGVLSAILYIIYVNDIVMCTDKVKYVIYADDTCVFADHSKLKDNMEIMNRELFKINEWMIANRLTVNTDKTNYMIFSRAQKKIQAGPFVLKLNGSQLNRVGETKYLGVIIDEHLSWKSHVSSIVAKLSKYVPIIYRVKDQLNTASLKLLYNTLIYPNLIYCNSVWGAANVSTLRPLVVAQKRIVRTMCNAPSSEHSAPLFKSLYFLNMPSINLYMCGLFAYKGLNSGSEWFTVYEPNIYNTRLSTMSTLLLPNLMTSNSRQSVRWVGATLWSGLPSELRNFSLGYQTFKRQLKKVLMDRQ